MSTHLVDRLRQWNPGGGVAAEVMREYNAFVLDLGMGPAFYMTMDGRILVDERWWFGDDVREATDNESISALVCGAQKTGIRELLDLIPPAPPESQPCSRCSGTRWANLGLKDVNGKDANIVCPVCSGRGWAG